MVVRADRLYVALLLNASRERTLAPEGAQCVPLYCHVLLTREHTKSIRVFLCRVKSHEAFPSRSRSEKFQAAGGSENVFAERQPRHATWRSQTALTGYPAADCAGPVQLRAQTTSCRRALMACAIIARLACRGWPAPLTNNGTAVYPRTTR